MEQQSLQEWQLVVGVRNFLAVRAVQKTLQDVLKQFAFILETRLFKEQLLRKWSLYSRLEARCYSIDEKWDTIYVYANITRREPGYQKEPG